MNKKNIALILSGGEGKRFDKKKPKQFFKINGQSILEITVKKFINSNYFDAVIIVCPLSFKQETLDIIKKYKAMIVTGGKTRQDSVFAGLNQCKKLKPDNVIIHDVVRPFFSKNLLKNILDNLKKKNV